jgi:hypothetical protein
MRGLPLGKNISQSKWIAWIGGLMQGNEGLAVFFKEKTLRSGVFRRYFLQKNFVSICNKEVFGAFQSILLWKILLRSCGFLCSAEEKSCADKQLQKRRHVNGW